MVMDVELHLSVSQPCIWSFMNTPNYKQTKTKITPSFMTDILIIIIIILMSYHSQSA